jgi:GNAT superfamily N-acetyltransferase
LYPWDTWKGERNRMDAGMESGMMVLEETRGEFCLSNRKEKLDVPFIQKWLRNESYWAKDRPAGKIARSIEHSLCIGLYHQDRQIGFARVVTDYATFAWICDLFVVREFRGRGLGKWLAEAIGGHPAFRDMLMILGTRDAHGLYKKFGGFERVEETKWMVRFRNHPAR